MKLASYLQDGYELLAIYHNGYLYNLESLNQDLPGTMGILLNFWEEYLPALESLNNSIVKGDIAPHLAMSANDLHLLAPVPHPASCRDGYAFRQHVAAARRNRKVDMIPEFDQYPIFYFTNHQSIQGPGKVRCMPDHFEKLDFELEVAVVISKTGRNVIAEEADSYIAGYMIMNDLSARRLQIEEMVLNLGPAKGKDFATAIGPWLVTPDELEPYKTAPKEGHTGNSYQLAMTCSVNGVQVSAGNMGDMDWTFAEIIERCSYGATIYPGDVIGSGTVGTGCFLELNGTGKLNDPNYQEQWLQEGDVVEMEVEGLGKLVNTIVAEDSDFSILDKKKML
ncbi:MAG: fumarylacetoacetate hydrolase family protein [Chitinophagaceae bacterium]|nr:fumarylacetoacetate hydrolase family protein [Chitinophagaceae bacterium]